MGIGDWGLGIGDWAQSPIPNPQLYYNYTILLSNLYYFYYFQLKYNN